MAKKAGKRTLGVIADAILENKLEVKRLNRVIEAHEAQIKTLEVELQAAAGKEELTSGGGTKSEWSIAPHTVPQVVNWDEVYAYIKENDYFHLLQRRPAVKACQEIWELGKVIPGVERFTINRVTIKEV